MISRLLTTGAIPLADKSYNFQVKKHGKNKALRKDGASKFSHLFIDTRLQTDIDKLNKKKS